MKKFSQIIVLMLIGSPIFAQMGGGFPGMGGGERKAGQSSQMGFPGVSNTNNQQQLEAGDGKIKGSIIDSLTKKPVEFASIALYKKSDKTKPVDGTMSDELGKFTLKDLPNGEFFLKISFIGYEDKVIDLPTTAKARKKFNLNGILLSPSSKLLEEVTVTGQKSLLEDKVDRLVFNAEVDKTSQGGNAGDVLRKVPMLSVDLDGNVSMRGSQNVKVLINNKPSSIMASSISDALKQIPAEMIKTVEVITSPSAKYDAEGTSGIINIITKKNNLQGITGMVNASLGNRGSNLFGNLNYRQGKFGSTLSGGGNMFYNPSDNTINQKTTNEAITYKTTQFSDNFDNGKFGNLQWGADYDINTKNSLSSSVRYGIRGFNNTQDITSTTLKNEVSYNSFTRNVKNTNQNQSVDINLDYVRKFENPQKEFGILTQFSQSNSDNSFTFTQNGVSTSNPNTGLTREGTFQMDFQTPISTNQIFEIGAKNVYRNISNDYQYLLKEKLEINTFNLNQNVSSSYLSYTLTTKNKFSFKPGLRYEYTLNDASLKDAKLNVKDYGNLVPSLQISKNLGGGKTMKASYNRRIQRPSLRFLSPGANTANTQNITIGNPELLPELTNAYELNLSAFKKATSVNVSLFFRDTKDAITQVRNTTESGGIITQYFNVGKSQSYGINLFGSTRITQKWQLNIGSNIFNQTVSNPSTNQSNSGVVVEGNFFLMGQLPKNWAFQAFGFLRGPQVQLQGRQSGYGTLNMGIRKDFKDKKGSIGLSLDNPFTKRLRFVSTFDADGLYQENINYRYNRGIRLTFSRQFGKMTFGNMNRKKKINNDDTKQDDSGNQGGGSVPR
jgi:outer membrane receptor protein involved in Fe transport